MMPEFFDKWAAYILAIATGVAGVVWGMKRAQIGNSYRLDQITRELEKLEMRVKDLETQGEVSAVSLARIEATLKTTMESVLESLREIKSEIRGKVDK